MLINQLATIKFSQKNKELVGVDIYSSDWYLFDDVFEFKFIISDISTSAEFCKTRNSMMFGAQGSLILFDTNHPDTLFNLEKWIFEIIITCGNIPILLLGTNSHEGAENISQSEINALIADKTNNWNLIIKMILLENNEKDKQKIFDCLSQEMANRLKNPSLIELPNKAFENLKTILMNETDLSSITHILYNLNRVNNRTAKKIVDNLSISYFVEIIEKEKVLIDLPKLVYTFKNIDELVAKELITDISTEKYFQFIKNEKELLEIELLLKYCKKINENFCDKLGKLIPLEILCSKFTEVWANIINETKKSKSIIKKPIQALEYDNNQIQEMLKNIDTIGQQFQQDFLDHVSVILSLLFSNNKKKMEGILGCFSDTIKYELLKRINEKKNKKKKKTALEKTLKTTAQR